MVNHFGQTVDSKNQRTVVQFANGLEMVIPDSFEPDKFKDEKEKEDVEEIRKREI